MKKLLTNEVKAILFGVILCALGAVALDCKAIATGITLITLGCLAMLLGPLAVNLND